MTRRQEGWVFVALAAVALFGWVLTPVLSWVGAGLLVGAFVIVGIRGGGE